MKFNCCISCRFSEPCHEFKAFLAIVYCRTIRKKIIERFYCRFHKPRRKKLWS